MTNLLKHPTVQVLTITALIWSSCAKKTPTDLTKNDLIPAPVSVSATGASFELSSKTMIYVDSENAALSQVAGFLREKLAPATGYELALESTSEKPQKGIYLDISAQNKTLGDEGYEMVIEEDLLTISANSPAGVFMGIQTLRQLLPAEIESNVKVDAEWTVATGTITDYPEYPWRGSMLDVSRHFFSVEDVKRYIDLIAGLKMNVMHLHLTDDQGWRIEIKSWPNLTAHGAKTQVGGGEGGFYTQEDYQDIVQYATERFITIIPEIDLPSHSYAALVSYPELNCDGKIPVVDIDDAPENDLPYTGTEVGFCTVCTDKEIVYQFVDDVVREVAAMTPTPYIHLGGDESHVTPLEDYVPFFNRVQQIVLKHGKKMIGWDEVANAQLDPSSLVQYWNETENTLMGIAQGTKVIMSPAHKAYLDMQYDSTSQFGLNWAAYIPVDTAYNWDPATIDPEIKRDHIIGVEFPLWAETIEKMDDIEYLLFPRIMGYAEIAWSPAEKRSWDSYKFRLGNQARRLKIQGIDYYPSSKIQWQE